MIGQFQVVEVFSLAALKENHPDWSWTANRCGFGWSYIGSKGDEIVEVMKTAAFGDEDGELLGDIRVYGSGRGELYFRWAAKVGDHWMNSERKISCGPVELQWVLSRECYYWETDNIQITVYPDGAWDVMLVDHMLCAACDDPETAAQEVASLLSAVAPGLLIFGGE